VITLTPILPKQFDPAVFIDEMMGACEETADLIERDFDATMKTWKKPVEFFRRKSFGMYEIAEEVFTVNKIYAYINYGTKRHKIPLTPKTQGALSFLWAGKGSFFAKTKHRWLRSRNWATVKSPAMRARLRKAGFTSFSKPGGERSFKVAGVKWGDRVFFKQVDHPGIKGREWDKRIATKRLSAFRSRAKEAIRRAAQRSGHAMK
jgi:hypothetical protein